MHFMQKLHLKQNVAILVGIVLIGILLIIAFASQMMYQELLNDRKEKTQNLVETVHGILQHYGSMVTENQLTVKEAQENAISMIESLRYAEKEYFWINDMQPVMIMHPYQPELNGQNLSNIKDADEKRLFVEMVNTVKERQAGFVEYMWPKPGLDQSQASCKISYVKGFEPWGWVVGSGLYMDDIKTVFRHSLLQMLAIGLICIMLLGLTAYVVLKSIAKPLEVLMALMKKVETTQDLRVRSDVQSQNETGQISQSLNLLIQSFQNSLREVKSVHHESNNALVQMRELVDNANASTQVALDRGQEVAHATTEMVDVLKEVSRNTQSTAETTQSVELDTAQGQEIVNLSIKKIENLANEINQAGEAIQELNGEVGNISKVIGVISSIAEQTNLLALNAAIEAARAGEQGRGFAVVADEVRSLAQRTQESTAHILGIIDALQRKSKTAVDIVSSGKSSADESVQQAMLAGEKLNAIATQMLRLTEMNTNVAASVEQQQVTINSINDQIDAIVSAVTHSCDCTSEASDHTNHILEKSSHLEKQMNKFVTD